MYTRSRSHISQNLVCTAQSSNLDLQTTVPNSTYPCPFEKLVGANCDVSALLPDMAQHVINTHSSECLEGPGEREWIELPLVFMQYQKAIFKLNQIFFILWSINVNWLRFIVFHVGHESNSSDYAYEFKIENIPIRISFGCICHHYLKDWNEVLQSGEYVLLHKRTVQTLLCRHGVTTYSLKIERQTEPMDTETSGPFIAHHINFQPNVALV
jgi:hypothetical protein